MMRSKLFVPAIRADLFAKAESSMADAISFDLEDSVPEDRKDEARELLGNYLRGQARSKCEPSKITVIRINAPSSTHFETDLASLISLEPDIVNLPMVEDPAEIRELGTALSRQGGKGNVGILVNIETPKGLRRAAELAMAHPKVMGLQIGYADLLEPCGMDRNDPDVLSFVRISVRLAAAEAGIDAYDGAFAATKDQDEFRAECLAARRQGFAGKSCIHPSQVAIANACFAPSEAEIAWARKVLDAAVVAEQKGLGAFLVDGQMIDKPFLSRARAVAAAAGNGANLR